jgi:phage tail-like protein
MLLGETDWSTCVDAIGAGEPLSRHFRRSAEPCNATEGTFAWDPRANEITLRPCVVQFEAAPNDRPPDPRGTARRGAARDRFGNVYWIAESTTELRVLASGSGRAAHFWSAGDGLACGDARRWGDFGPLSSAPPQVGLRMSGLAVTDDHHLCVGVLDPAGVLVFDLHAGGPPEQLLWPAGVAFAPFDMAARAGGGAWILDRANRRYWGLDRQFAIIALQPAPPLEPRRSLFQPLDEPVVSPPSAPQEPQDASAAQVAADDPVSIEGLPDGTVLVLDRLRDTETPRILRYRLHERLADVEWHEPFGMDVYDVVFLPDAGREPLTGQLLLAALTGNQAYTFAASSPDAERLVLSLVPEYLPMRLFGGKGLVASDGEAFYDFADGWVPLVAQRRPRYAHRAVLQTPSFDGREPGCVWHRLMLDACIPAEALVAIRSRAADEERDLGSADWQQEPRPYLRRDGSELPYAPGTSRDRAGTWELLFQRARGRFLQLELTFQGNGRVTPRVRAMRMYYPRFSYLERYLPGVYREDAESASFLERFLANLEGFYTTTEDRIAAVQVLFDHRSAPRETLDWLAGWFGVALDPAWPEAKRRLFVRHATEFFERRGTTSGLRAAIRLAAEECADDSIFAPSSRRRPEGIRIVEQHRTRRRPAVVEGDPTGAEGLRVVPQQARWTPAQGRDVLNARFRAVLQMSGLDVSAATEFPLRAPDDADIAVVWRRFALETLGFVPSASPDDLTAWRDFLARRHGRQSAFAAAYRLPQGLTVSFDSLSLPSALPFDGPPLTDWWDFESVVLAMRRSAHRFAVLLPVPAGAAREDLRQERLGLVSRVVALEKPAHTAFDVKFYWALFRVGEARLGIDSLVDRGGRAPELLPALRLGQAYLAESHLTPAHPHDVADRHVIGRDALGGSKAEGRDA